MAILTSAKRKKLPEPPAPGYTAPQPVANAAPVAKPGKGKRKFFGGK